jgi:hypothetical protein
VLHYLLVEAQTDVLLRSCRLREPTLREGVGSWPNDNSALADFSASERVVAPFGSVVRIDPILLGILPFLDHRAFSCTVKKGFYRFQRIDLR